LPTPAKRAKKIAKGEEKPPRLKWVDGCDPFYFFFFFFFTGTTEIICE